MVTQAGLRERKKAETRQRIADAAARLFAEHGFDAVAIADVARAADVAEQTVYNYFPAKHDLALDRAEAIRRRLHALVVDRPTGSTPAAALRVIATEDIERHRGADPREARGQFFALCISSPVVRRFGLEVRDQQVATIRDALAATDPDLDVVLAHLHAAALVAALQLVGDHIGRRVVHGEDPDDDDLDRIAQTAFDDLDRRFRHLNDTSAREDLL
ncbi:TetR/AcrR family transcriptional regulator [Actinomycetospora sp. C-140]